MSEQLRRFGYCCNGFSACCCDAAQPKDFTHRGCTHRPNWIDYDGDPDTLPDEWFLVVIDSVDDGNMKCDSAPMLVTFGETGALYFGDGTRCKFDDTAITRFCRFRSFHLRAESQTDIESKQIEPPATVATRSTGNGASEPSARRDAAAGARTSPDLLDEAMARTYGSAPSHGGRR